MFRSELVDVRRFPAAAAAGDRACAELQRLVRGEGTGSPGTPIDQASLHWSVVHGLAGLVPEGVPPPRTTPRAHVDALLELQAYRLG